MIGTYGAELPGLRGGSGLVDSPHSWEPAICSQKDQPRPKPAPELQTVADHTQCSSGNKLLVPVAQARQRAPRAPQHCSGLFCMAGFASGAPAFHQRRAALERCPGRDGPSSAIHLVQERTTRASSSAPKASAASRAGETAASTSRSRSRISRWETCSELAINRTPMAK